MASPAVKVVANTGIDVVKSIPVIGGVLGSVLGGIFGGKDYVSSEIGIFGGGGKRDMSWTQSSPSLANYHYAQVVTRLGFQNFSNASTEQRRAFWNAWDSTMQMDADAFKNLPVNYLASQPSAGKSNMTPWLVAGGVAVVALIFTMRR